MCECGCLANDRHYTFPGPGKDYYLLTLTAGCVSCDGEAGVSIQLLKDGTFEHKYYKNRDYTDGKVEFRKWSSTMGVFIATGLRKIAFIEKLVPHLTAIDHECFGDDNHVDEIAAEELLDEAYADVVVMPHFIGESDG